MKIHHLSRARNLATIAVLLSLGFGLTACSDPGSISKTETTAAALTPVAQAASAEPIRAQLNQAAADQLPAELRARGKLTVANAVGAVPLGFFATDNKTIVGSEPAIAQAVADALGLKLELQATSWANWPLGLGSGKYDAVISNVTVTEERKERFDFSTYRQDQLGFYAKSDSNISKISGAADVAGKRIIVSSGTNQEKVLLAWDAQNKASGLPAVEFQYYDDVSAADLAIQSGRSDLPFGPNAMGAYKAALNGKTKLVGLVPGLLHG